MPRRKEKNALERAFARLDANWSDLGVRWDLSNKDISQTTGEQLQYVRAWRRSHVELYYAEHGTTPPLSHVRIPGSTRKPRELSPLDETHGHLALDWNASTGRIARESGHFRASVIYWRRRHLMQWIAAGNEAPECRCGKEIYHMGSCGSVPRHKRLEAAAKIASGADPDAVARTYRTDRNSVISWTIATIPIDQRVAFKEGLRRTRLERNQRMRESANRRKAVDSQHARIIAAVGQQNPEFDDAVQEAYLAMLEDGHDPEKAAKLGVSSAFRMSTIGWKATSLDAPISDDSSLTRGDMIRDERPDQSSSLAHIDRLRMEGRPIGDSGRSARIAERPRVTIEGLHLCGGTAATENAMNQHEHRADVLRAVIAKQRASGLSIGAASKGARVRNVDAHAIIGGRQTPTDGQLARLADHFGIPHSIAVEDATMVARRNAPKQKKGVKAKRKKPAAKTRATLVRAEAPVADEKSTLPTAGPTSLPNADHDLIDSMVAALQSAKSSGKRLEEAQAALSDAIAERDEQKSRADDAEARLAEVERQMEIMRGILHPTAANGNENGRIAA